VLSREVSAAVLTAEMAVERLKPIEHPDQEVHCNPIPSEIAPIKTWSFIGAS
jgi:hypothetical protein